MQTLVEKYQPTKIDDFIGIQRAKRLFKGLAANPKPTAILAIGPPGAGKTTIGLAFAQELPGSLVHVPAQKCDVAMLDELRNRFAYSPPIGKFWIALIDEIDQATDKAQLQLLSRLDSTSSLRPVFGGGFERGEAPPIIWIFTCNGIGPEQTIAPTSLLPRFQSRCMPVAFPAATIPELASYLEEIWNLEGGEKAPAGYFEYMAAGVGARDALMRLEMDLMAGPREVVKEEAIIVTASPRHKSSYGTVEEIRHNAAVKAWETRRRRAIAA